MSFILDTREAKRIATDGYAVFKQALTKENLTQLQTATKACLPASDFRGGNVVQWSPLFSADHNAAKLLFMDPDLRLLAERAVGSEVCCVMVDVNRAKGPTDCHSDAQDWELKGIRFNIYLQPLTPGSGALRIFPASHKREIWERLVKSPALTSELDSVCQPVSPGDILAMDLRLWHDVESDQTTPREFASVFFYALPETPTEVEAIRRSARRNRRALSIFKASDLEFSNFATSGALPRSWENFLVEYGFLERRKFESSITSASSPIVKTNVT
ncbi:phytanoyl-CoA dioxygenase family protein [Paraburkholderia tropica]|uniref:Phytanoyl-CoA dioxygenase (PhyH) n=1 Tax=Paraburkholderia tropica TaxID=92647 RepID=A0AAQ1GMK4_9BURK|nr:phytanoyl-CoA dioxygenase family protein [Paraburkholderia tropica]SEK13042.1 Phytanoyl-CoA dioxygenase (PhyH) [Paraburkholderia tropica]